MGLKIHKNGIKISEAEIIDLIEGSNISYIIEKDVMKNKIKITINSTGGGGSGLSQQQTMAINSIGI